MAPRLDEIVPVTIESIDGAVYDWLDRTVDAHVEHPSGERRKVPVSFSSGERWAMARERRGVRDEKGVLILPIIAVQRTGIEPDPSMTALGTETPVLQVSRRVDPKSSRLANLEKLRAVSQRGNTKPAIYEVTTIPFPDRSIMTYELVIQAQYVTQMNAILEKIFHELDLGKSFVAPVDGDKRHAKISEPFEERRPPVRGHYVVGFFDANVADVGNLEEFTDQERIVKYNTSFRVPAVLQLDPEGERPSIRTERTSFHLGFGDERVVFVDDPAELELVFGGRGR